jgi:hypothetical protein
MPNTLTLSTNGPTPNPLNVPNGDRSITIVNELNVSIELQLDPAGFLNPSPGATLTVPTTGWTGTVGPSGGNYSYVDPSSTKKGTRSGRINVE